MRELNITYNNTFNYVKKLQKVGLLDVNQTGEQNNPSIIIPLISDDIDIREKSKLKEACKDKNKITGIIVTIKKKESGGVLWEESKLIYKEMRELIPSKAQYSMKVIKDEKIKSKNITINFLFEPDKTSDIPKLQQSERKDNVQKP